MSSSLGQSKNKLGLSCAKLSSSLVSIKFAELVTLFRMGGGGKDTLTFNPQRQGDFYNEILRHQNKKKENRKRKKKV